MYSEDSLSDKNKKRIAFVVQRYGKEVIGGAETYAKEMAEHLAAYYKDKIEVEVLTSKALDFKTWSNHYTEDVEEINGVKVRRFEVTKGRNPLYQRGGMILMRNFGIKNKTVEENRIRGRGPYVPGLVEYIKANKDDYDRFIFVTYMYYPTYFGSKEVYDKAILVSTAHDEEPIYMDVYKDMFNSVSGMIYLADEEKEFVEKTFDNGHVKNAVIGMGIEVPEDADGDRFKEKYGINGRYIIYAGRIETEKGVDKLISFYEKFRAGSEDKDTVPKLVLMGKGSMDIPKKDGIIATGFVDDKTKYDAFKGASVILLPSMYESFSISLLEGMAYSHPALVNGKSEVLKGHILKSNGGKTYTSYEEFKDGLDTLLKEPDDMGKKAALYVKEKYGYESIMKRFEEML